MDEYNALVDALEHRWSHTDELLLALCRLVDNLTRITVAVHGGQRAVGSLGHPFKYPRPGEKTGPTVMRPRELAAQMMKG